MASAIKAIVSKKKRRYVQDGFNLDLTYINQRIIAMGYPAEKVEALWRNPLEQVKSFLEKKHKNHYKIYNLCSEREYDAKKFHGRVVQFPFDDHNPPNFNIIKLFCEDVQNWLNSHPENVCAIHCKAGKGRTGLMICCYLLHTNNGNNTAESVLELYGRARTLNYKGVTIPSQRRYISYYSYVVQGTSYYPTQLFLTSIVIDPQPNYPLGVDNKFHFEVYQMNRESIDSSAEQIYVSKPFVFRRNERQVRLDVEPIAISGDVKIEFWTHVGLERMVGLGTKKEFHFWFNTFFTANNRFENVLTHSIISSSQTKSFSKFNPILNINNNNNNNNHNNNSSSTCSSSSNNKSKSNTTNTTTSSSSNNNHHRGNTNTMGCSSSGGGSSGDPINIGRGGGECSGFDSEYPSVERPELEIEEDNLSNLLQNSSLGAENNELYLSSDSKNNVRKTCSSNSASFSEKRIRHCSFPQTTSNNFKPLSSSSSSSTSYTGTKINLSLNKFQLDKASKDKSCKIYDDKFCVTLFLIRPLEQPDLEYWKPPSLHSTLHHPSSSSPETSSAEDETLGPSGIISQSTWI